LRYLTTLIFNTGNMYIKRGVISCLNMFSEAIISLLCRAMVAQCGHWETNHFKQ